MKTKKLILIILLILVLSLFLIRLTTPKEIDDINPLIPCENNLIQKADVLWVIPIYKNMPISENKTWCTEILNLNKTIGMHGIYHTYHEFNSTINETEIQKAKGIFKECFGYEPEIFKAPNLALSQENKFLLEQNNLSIRTPYHQTIHKVYHCSDTGTLPNWFHLIF